MEALFETPEYKGPVHYYQWERLDSNGNIVTTTRHIREDQEGDYIKEGWRRIESSKRRWDDYTN